MHGDNNPYWLIPQCCTQCKQHIIQNKTLHKILQCRKNNDRRKEVFSSIITELNYIGTKFYGFRCGQNAIIPHETCNQILDASVTGYIKDGKTVQQALKTLIGGNISKNLTDIAVTQVTRVMIAHIYLLINIFPNKIYEPKNWTQMPDNTMLATEDLEAGEIVVRTKVNNRVQCMNIRDKLEQMTIPQLQNYEIGLGARLAKIVPDRDIFGKDSSLSEIPNLSCMSTVSISV